MTDMDMRRGLASLIEARKADRGWSDADLAEHATRRGRHLTRGGVQAARTRRPARIDRASVETWSVALELPESVIVDALLVSTGLRPTTGGQVTLQHLELLIADAVPDPAARRVVQAALRAGANLEEVGRDEHDAAPMNEAAEQAANIEELRGPDPARLDLAAEDQERADEGG